MFIFYFFAFQFYFLQVSSKNQQLLLNCLRTSVVPLIGTRWRHSVTRKYEEIWVMNTLSSDFICQECPLFLSVHSSAVSHLRVWVWAFYWIWNLLKLFYLSAEAKKAQKCSSVCRSVVGQDFGPDTGALYYSELKFISLNFWYEILLKRLNLLIVSEFRSVFINCQLSFRSSGTDWLPALFWGVQVLMAHEMDSWKSPAGC